MRTPPAAANSPLFSPLLPPPPPPHTRSQITKPISAYDSDSKAALEWLARHPLCTGKLGVMGFCIGGHLAFRGAMNKGVLAAACFYATDIHNRTLGKGKADNTLERVPELAAAGTEMLMIWGRQDPHVSREGRALIMEVGAGGADDR